MDFNRIGLLLHIEEKVRNQPSLKSIHDRVMKELRKHAEDEEIDVPIDSPPPVQPLPEDDNKGGTDERRA